MGVGFVDIWRRGMITSAGKIVTEQVAATSVRFEENKLCVSLDDGREIVLPMDRIEWLRWLYEATPPNAPPGPGAGRVRGVLGRCR